MLEMALKLARSGLMDMTGRKIELTVQKLLMDRLLGMKAAPGRRSPSQLFSAMREFSSVREFFTASSIGTLADIPFIFLFLALVASIGGNLMWVLVAGGVLMVLPGFLLQKRMIALTKSTQGASARASRLLHEAIYEHETVSTARGAERFKRIWEELITLSAVKSAEQRKLSSMLTYWAQMVQQATYVTAVVVGTYKVFVGDFTVGSIIAIGILTSRTLAPLTQLAGTLSRWSNTKAALEGLEAIAEADQVQAGRGGTICAPKPSAANTSCASWNSNTTPTGPRPSISPRCASPKASASRCWARTDRGNRRCSSCLPGSMSPRAGGSCWTGWIWASCIRAICGGRSAIWGRMCGCFPAPCGTT